MSRELKKRSYRAIDMPHDDLGSYGNFDVRIRARIMELIEAARAEGRWRASEDMLWNPQDVEFMAYWAQKCVDPITRPMAGSGLEAYFRPFMRTRYELAPRGFVAHRVRRLSAAGDLMPGVHLEDSRDRLFRDVADLMFGADCAFANLECSIVSGQPGRMGDFDVGQTPLLRVSRGQFEALTRHCGRSFDVLQLANNHVLDCGDDGVARTIAALKHDGIEFVGANESEEASRRPKTTKLGDVTLGWVAHTFSTNQKSPPPGKEWMIDVTPFHVERAPDTSRIKRQIAAARSAGADIVLVCLHWGAEWEFFPLPVQLDWAHAFAEAGADAIIGTHPHVIQPVEIYRPKSNPEKAVPVIYSLGNLTTTMGADYTTLSLVANLTVASGKVGRERRTLLSALDVTPVAFMGEQEDGARYAVCVPLARLHDSHLDAATRAYVDAMTRYADLVLGEDWRMATAARREAAPDRAS